MGSNDDKQGNDFPQKRDPAIVHVAAGDVSVVPLPPPMVGNIKEEPLTVSNYMALKGYLPHYRDILLCKALRGTGLRIAEVLDIRR